MKKIDVTINAITGEETIIEREETTQEKSEREIFEAKVIAEKAETQAKENARAEILNRLGLTAEEAALLIS